MDIRQTLINVINTLNQIPVVGRANLSKMLGTIDAVEKVVAEIDRLKTEAAEKEESK